MLIPVLTLGLTAAFKLLPGGGPARGALLALGVACTSAFLTGCLLTRTHPREGAALGRRLLDASGWVVTLPLLLAVLGVVFQAAGVGEALAHLLRMGLPVDHRWVALLAYALGMTLLSALVGNAFAAFPVMMAGLGGPVLVRLHGADPAILGALGMLAGYCGTLVTPMAANFNALPVRLLDLEDPLAVIRVQAPTAALVWLANLGIMGVAVFR